MSETVTTDNPPGEAAVLDLDAYRELAAALDSGRRVALRRAGRTVAEVVPVGESAAQPGYDPQKARELLRRMHGRSLRDGDGFADRVEAIHRQLNTPVVNPWDRS